jgi:hypothetical protein
MTPILYLIRLRDFYIYFIKIGRRWFQAEG